MSERSLIALWFLCGFLTWVMLMVRLAYGEKTEAMEAFEDYKKDYGLPAEAIALCVCLVWGPIGLVQKDLWIWEWRK
jgi:hypothetical protein